LFSTLADATSANIVLLEGEKWQEKDAATGLFTGRTKTGKNGVLSADKTTITGTAFSDLPFDPSGGGASLSDTTPQALGAAVAGTAATASRSDHRHAMPTAAQVGADATGTAGAAVAAHAAAADPHPSYTTAIEAAAAAPVQSVAGRTGAVVLGVADVSGLGSAAQSATTDFATAAQGADPREWSAATATQAEAEAGSSTTRLAFTPQRVFQAIAAWWAANTGATGRAVVSAATQAGGRTALGLGSAAQSATTDFATAAALSGYVQTAALSGYVQTNDARLTDARTPTAHSQAASTITGLATVATSGSYGDLTGAIAATSATISGQVYLSSSASAAAPSLALESTNTGFFAALGGAFLTCTVNASSHHRAADGVFVLRSNIAFGWCIGDPHTNNQDLSLFRDAADVLAQRRTVNGQVYRVYRTYTNDTNYERVALNLSTNTFTFGPQAAGTGTLRPLYVSTGFTTVAGLSTTVQAGTTMHVTDATSTTPRSVAVGGGSNFCQVMRDNSGNWLIVA